ncbi:FAD-dependent thymidylate synthase [Shinella pollutisoli]|uniref:Flavin-dependent thymidylate synthase n=1 Tax=Shinella pollutisoli TaxID=2250594 RepID=A0ABV7DQA4_9HYPH|nr:FAD-dependent thymidylate synthase [Shinella pollutisoli]
MALSKIHSEDVSNARAECSTTLRPTVPELEALLHTPLPVLDHGFVRVVDYMGDDNSVVQAARVSYGKGTKKVSEDRSLIRYLMRHRHTTPFEMAEIKLHVKLPIFVARQWVRHRTASINEYSARYSVLDKEFYIPSEEQIAAQSSNNKQGRGEILSIEDARFVMHLLKDDAERNYSTYKKLINDPNDNDEYDSTRQSVARELARINLSLNTYTQWYWKTDLHNLLNFLQLRADGHAQYEIRVYAEAILEILKVWTPITYEAFCDYRMHSLTLSRMALEVLKRVLAGETVTEDSSGLTPREWAELDTSFALSRKNSNAS